MSSTTVRMISKDIDIGNKNPILIAGFPGIGLLGTICANYMIDKLNLYHIACVESDFVYPGVVYIDGKIRHPFRIYANDSGKICIMVCEAPIVLSGIHSVLRTVMEWAVKNSVSEVLVMDGISTFKTTNERIPIVLGSSEYEYNNSTDYDNKITRTNLTKPYSLKRSNRKNATFIGGVTGGILAACLSLQLKCAAILIPSRTGTPDPEGAIAMIKTFNEIIRDNKLKVDIQELIEQSQILKKQLKQMIKTTDKQGKEIIGINPKKLRMYG